MGDWKLRWFRGAFAAVRYENGKRHRHTLGTTDKAEAQRLIEQLNRAETTPEDARTINALWHAYLREYHGRSIAKTMSYTGKALIPHFGAIEPGAITIDDCRSYTDLRRAQGRADGSIHTELGHLRSVLVWAQKRRLIVHAPHIERPPKPAPKDRHLTREEVRRLRDAAELPHVRLGITLLYSTGARIEALSQLTWDRVDFERGLVRLRDPDDRSRRKGRATVPMNGELRAALSEARKAALTPFVIEWAGAPVKSMRRALRNASERAGLEPIGHHIFRHSAAVWMAEAGRSMEEIAQFLGHEDVATTRKVYARFSPDYLRESAEILTLDGPASRLAGSNEPRSAL